MCMQCFILFMNAEFCHIANADASVCSNDTIYVCQAAQQFSLYGVMQGNARLDQHTKVYLVKQFVLFILFIFSFNHDLQY